MLYGDLSWVKMGYDSAGVVFFAVSRIGKFSSGRLGLVDKLCRVMECWLIQLG